MIKIDHVNKELKHKNVLCDITFEFQEGKDYLLKVTGLKV